LDDGQFHTDELSKVFFEWHQEALQKKSLVRLMMPRSIFLDKPCKPVAKFLSKNHSFSSFPETAAARRFL